MKKQVFIFLFEGFSDWEIAYLTTEIKKNKKFDLIYFSNEGKTILSMGGLQISPDISLKEINTEDVEMLILPGGEAWAKDENDSIDYLVKKLFAEGKTIAAICAATGYLGKEGFLNKLKHTSNDLSYLKGVAPKYVGEQNYINSLAVTDKNLITASGIAAIEFAREIFKKLRLYNDDENERWYQLFKNGIWSQ